MKDNREKLFEGTLRNMVRERIKKLMAVKKEAKSPPPDEEEQNPVPPADQQPPEPPAKDITQSPQDKDKITNKPKIVGDQPPPKPKDINDPTAAPVDINQLKNERIARFIQTVSNTSKADLQFIINDTAPDTKAKTIKLFLKLIGVSPNDVSALITTTDQNKPTEKDKPAIPPTDTPV